jgi:hypothetical protein
MRVVHDRPEARLLPARHHFALTRLIAYCRLRFARPQTMAVDHLILSIDPDQTASEIYAACIWVVLTLSCFVAALLPLPVYAAAIASIPIAVISLQLLFVGGGIALLLLGIENRSKPNSVLIMTVMVTAASYFALSSSPARYVAWFFLAVVLANAIAYGILALLRQTVREVESRCAM